MSLYACGCPDPNTQEHQVTVIADGDTYGPATPSGGHGYINFNIATAHLGVHIQTVCVDKETGEPITEPTEDVGDVLIDPDGFVFDIDRGGGGNSPGAKRRAEPGGSARSFVGQAGNFNGPRLNQCAAAMNESEKGQALPKNPHTRAIFAHRCVLCGEDV